jgi:hypothetical protein
VLTSWYRVRHTALQGETVWRTSNPRENFPDRTQTRHFAIIIHKQYKIHLPVISIISAHE